jgi:hypothetical protein
MKKSASVLIALALLFAACSNPKLDEKGFQVSPVETEGTNEEPDGLSRDSLKFETRPSGVLLTGVPDVRLAPLFKVNINKRNNTTFIGSSNFHYKYEDTEVNKGNNWNNNLMPGLAAAYGYNMVNVLYYNIKENKQKNFFDKSVLIRTLYYPTFSKDTLNGQPVKRSFFMVSVYNDDTNKDGFINIRDLRRLYLIDINGDRQKALIPENYSVVKSEYDPDNDFMFVFAQLDSNGNGKADETEQTHIFWVDLKDPSRTGRLL